MDIAEEEHKDRVQDFQSIAIGSSKDDLENVKAVISDYYQSNQWCVNEEQRPHSSQVSLSHIQLQLLLRTANISTVDSVVRQPPPVNGWPRRRSVAIV